MKMNKVAMVCFAALSLIFMVAIGNASAATYYVAPTGNNDNPGTSSSPFLTIQHAANIVNPGDTVIVKDGTYTAPASECLVLLHRGGTENNWITFQSENKYGAVLDGENAPDRPYGFQTNGVNYIRILDFEVKRFLWGGVSATFNDLVMPTQYSHDIVIKGNRIHQIGN